MSYLQAKSAEQPDNQLVTFAYTACGRANQCSLSPQRVWVLQRHMHLACPLFPHPARSIASAPSLTSCQSAWLTPAFSQTLPLWTCLSHIALSAASSCKQHQNSENQGVPSSSAGESRLVLMHTAPTAGTIYLSSIILSRHLSMLGTHALIVRQEGKCLCQIGYHPCEAVGVLW